MGELEGLDTDEPLPQRVERHAFDRLIMLSDGVFAIAITLAALEIRPRAAWNDLASLWNALRPSVYAYTLSFAVISAYWSSHRDVFARLKRVDAPMTVLTLALLFAVAVLPTTTRLVYEGGTVAAFQLYCLSLAGVGLLQALIWAYAAFAPRLMRAEVTMRYRVVRFAIALVVPTFFLVMAAAQAHGFDRPALVAAAAVTLGVAVLRRAVMPRLERAAG